MPDAKAPEPSIEEILASIRKIISDDDPEADTAPLPVKPDAEPEPVAEEDTVLDLTDAMAAEPEAPVHAEAVRAPEPAPRAVPMPPPEYHAPAAPPRGEALASERTVAVASDAIARLAHYEPPVHGSGGKSVEDIVREMLHPMLRDWIDQNLAAIVERLVDRELKKISRKAEDS